jgi:hypothetical protein
VSQVALYVVASLQPRSNIRKVKLYHQYHCM